MPSINGIMMSKITRSTLSPARVDSAAVPSAGLQAGKAGVLQMLADQVTDARFVINDQNLCHICPLLMGKTKTDGAAAGTAWPGARR